MDDANNASKPSGTASGWNLRPLSELREKLRDARQEVDRKVIVDQALTLISEVYAHLPFKEATEAIDPVQDLRLLSLRVGPRQEPANADLAPMTELEFHAQLSLILNSLRDAHTVYLAPGAEQGQVAFLPVLIEGFDGSYVLTKIAEGVDAGNLKPGSVITHWNGRPMDDYVDWAADLTPGANPAARHARAVARMTCRWIGNGILPPEDWVVLSSEDGHEPFPWWVVDVPRPHSVKCQLRAARTHADGRTNAGEGTLPAPGEIVRTHAGAPVRTHAVGRARTHAIDVGIDSATELIRRLKTALYSKPDKKPEAVSPLQLREPDHVEAYLLRVWTFDVPDVDAFVDEARKHLQTVGDVPLVIDVRGNPGGLIAAGHGLLQLLSPDRVEPASLEFLATQRTLALAERLVSYEQDEVQRAAMYRVADSIRYALASGQRFSVGAPFEDASLWDGVGPVRKGPTVVIVDPLSYSTTEIFAAGFQDLDLGPVVGTGPMTGGGGGNPWRYEELSELLELPSLQATGSGVVPSFDLTVRRIVRVRGGTRTLLEGTGVVPEAVYGMTRDDVLPEKDGPSNSGLMKGALQVLNEWLDARGADVSAA